jgi:hypothetical protein
MKFKKVVVFFLSFAVILGILFVLWYPIAPYYAYVRLWITHKMLNLVGYYPVFSTQGNLAIQGEYFAFLPYLALMICTYKKAVLKEWKILLFVFCLLVGVEFFGKFLEQLHSIRPWYLTYVFSIFLLASARVAIPFIAWWISMEKNKLTLF